MDSYNNMTAKPHIIKYGAWYRCTGRRWMAHGGSPKEAYHNWKQGLNDALARIGQTHYMVK